MDVNKLAWHFPDMITFEQMKQAYFTYLLPAIIALWILATGCVNKSHEASNDEINNKYYYEYMQIYRAYGKVPADSTIESLHLYLNKFADNTKAWVFLATVFIDQQQLAKAEAAYRTALYYNEKYAPAIAGLGTLYSWAGKLDSAAILVNQGIAGGDSTAYNFLNLAVIDLKRNDTAGARSANAYFNKMDTLSVSTLTYLVAINKELKNDSAMFRANEALRNKQVIDSTLDMYLANKIGVKEFFIRKEKHS